MSTKRKEVPLNLLLRVRPQQIGVKTLVRHLLETVDAVDVVHGADERRDASVHAHDLVVDHSRNAQAVEYVHEVLPRVRASVLLHALVVEAVHLRDLASLVVAAEQRDAVGVTRLQGEEQLDTLHAEVAAIHVVAHENVFGVRHISAETEQLAQVVELTMDVSANANGSGNGLHASNWHS